MKVLSCASATKEIKQSCNNFSRAGEKTQKKKKTPHKQKNPNNSANCFLHHGKLILIHIDRVKHNMPPIKLTTSLRDTSLILQLTVTNRTLRGPHLHLSPLISVSFYQKTAMVMEAHLCLLEYNFNTTQNVQRHFHQPV